MKKLRLSTLFDTIFCASSIFLVSFVILNYFIRRPYSIIISISFAVLTSMIAFRTLNTRTDKTSKSKQFKAQVSQMFCQLAFDGKEKVLSRFERVFKKLNLATERKKGNLRIPEKNLLVSFKFGFVKPSKADVVKVFNLINKSERAVIFCEEFDDELKSFADLFNGKIILYQGEKIYSLLEQNDELPQITCPAATLPKKKKAHLKSIFTKKSAKRFFSFGMIFLLMSFFVPIKLYYIVCGCTMMIISVLATLFGKNQVTF